MSLKDINSVKVSSTFFCLPDCSEILEDAYRLKAEEDGRIEVLVEKICKEDLK